MFPTLFVNHGSPMDRYVLVNGAVTIENDRQTNSFSGRLLRDGG